MTIFSLTFVYSASVSRRYYFRSVRYWHFIFCKR